MEKKIKFYTHPDGPRQEQLLAARDWTAAQIFEYHEQCKAQHRALHGETEAERLTKGRRIVFRKLENY